MIYLILNFRPRENIFMQGFKARKEVNFVEVPDKLTKIVVKVQF